MNRALAITVAFALFIVLSVPASSQWASCPFGVVDEAYPGTCARYVDTDMDGICDRSQPAPEDRSSEVVTEIREATLQPDAQPGKQTATSMSFLESPNMAFPKIADKYDAVPISIAMVVLIAVFEVLVKRGILSSLTVKYFWNVLLAVSFMLAIATILPSLYPFLNLGVSRIVAHVQAGIVMMWITFYHLWGRRRFYTACTPFGKKKKRD